MSKKGLIIGGIALLAVIAGGTGLTLFLKSDKHKEKKAEKDANKGDENLTPEQAEKLEGKQVIAKSGGANIRVSPKVNNSIYFCNNDDVSWYDTVDNGLVERAEGLLGTFVEKTVGEDKRDWYKIKLAEPITISYSASTLAGEKQQGKYEYGWVRSENVIIK